MREHKKSRFLSLLEQRVIVFDGAMGASVHLLDLSLDDYSGCENCPEILVETRPDCIEQIHRGFLEVGCDVIETDSFGGSRLTLAEFGLDERTHELNRKAAEIARSAADQFSTPDHPRFVAGSIGPGTKLITLRQTDYDSLLASHLEQTRGLLDGGVDLLIIETCQDILQAKTAIHAARIAMENAGRNLPLIVQVTMETTGTMLIGSDIAAALTAIDAFPEVDVIGLNCATGPQEMSEHIRCLAQYSQRPISVMPNAGLPELIDGQPRFPLTPEELARWLREFVEVDGVRIVGGCCGTTPKHLKAVVEAVRGLNPGCREPMVEPSSSSIYQSVPHRQDNSFLIVGERCNTNGSRKFKRLVAEGDLEGLINVGIDQVRHEGAHVLDVCVDYVGRDGVRDMAWLMDRFSRDVQAPIMLDSTEPDVIEAGLKLAGGKCIINSVNLEDGERRLARVCGLARQYGAALVALTIDEDPEEAMAKTCPRKLEIATRLHELLTGKYGIPEEDIFFDLLTFPITTGNAEDRRLGLETLDGIRAVMQKYPRCQAVLGLSNISFGLQPAARVVLNSVYLREARARGLTAAIVHAGKILPENKIGAERWSAALDLIYDRLPDGAALEQFMSLFEDGEKLAEKIVIAELPLEQRLRQRIIDGQKQGLESDLDQALEKYEPLAIINEHLLEGMKVVGELFGAGKMQLPFVLKSAEAMKVAVAQLEPHMERVKGRSRGKLVLATVRGDVHDIGKNLVDIIVSNNGFEVYNLGIRQPINAMVEALREHDADAIGMSGLLVKSTVVMRENLEVLNELGVTAPVILGGAALTRHYVEQELRAIYKGPLFYAKDAFEGLELIRGICEGDALEKYAGSTSATPVPSVAETGGDEPAPPVAEPDESLGRRNLEQLQTEIEQRFGLREIPQDDDTPAESAPGGPTAPLREPEQLAATVAAPRSDIAHELPVPLPPFWGARVLEKIELKAALAFLNETMLFQVQWGYRRKGRSREDWKRYVDAEIRPHYRELVERCERERILQPQAVYGHWPCNADGDDLIVYEPPTTQEADRRLQGTNPQSEIRNRKSQIENRKSKIAHGPEIHRFSFPRQTKPPFRCLADFWRPVDSGSTDVVAFHVVTAGRRVSEVAREWFAANEYQQYLFLHGLGVETAEALAEYVHKQVRRDLGFAQHDARELQKLFKQGYQGSRFSFGYPACPKLEDQVALLKLLGAERIGLTLSEEYQLDPEQSTSAIITYHPAARYFSVR